MKASTTPAPKRLRCAVYTRKSTDEGMELEYTSIDAQRDAGQSYIASRRAEGWIPVGTDYDDAGFSGGTLQRPALQRLLDDIRAGHIDIVIAYKIDRLSRSLFDFAELVKVFDQHGVTFVSVTQQFNTTDAMGRMLLNILLTFAQFERELTAERIRDKMIASKKKGFWMHGVPPLGFDLVDRRLVEMPEEAEQVRQIFRRFVELGSILKVAKEMRDRGLRNKTWKTKAGRTIEGQLHDKSSVHKILHNRSYLGELKHRDQYFLATHTPIINTGRGRKRKPYWRRVGHAPWQYARQGRLSCCAGCRRAQTAARWRRGTGSRRAGLPLLPQHARDPRRDRRVRTAAPAGGRTRSAGSRATAPGVPRARDG
jgi:site-specific DNA recombinase